MLLGCTTYLTRFLLRALVVIGFILSFSIAASAQFYHNDIAEKYPKMNPLLFDAFKKPVKPNPLLSEYVKPSKHELIYWRPLTPAQVVARDRRYEQSLGQQIIGSIAESYINSLLYGKKTPVAVAPKF